MKDEFSLSSYLYDGGPNRVWQLTGDIDRMWINGHDYIDIATLDNVTMYASPEITISGHECTKQYFMGSERIASNFGSGFANAVTPVTGTQTLISNPQGSLQIISNQLVDKLFRSWDCVGIIPEYVELQTDISTAQSVDYFNGWPNNPFNSSIIWRPAPDRFSSDVYGTIRFAMVNPNIGQVKAVTDDATGFFNIFDNSSLGSIVGDRLSSNGNQHPLVFV